LSEIRSERSDGEVLPNLTEEDLTELGVTIVFDARFNADQFASAVSIARPSSSDALNSYGDAVEQASAPTSIRGRRRGVHAECGPVVGHRGPHPSRKRRQRLRAQAGAGGTGDRGCGFASGPEPR
jgi:hypothetical protein